MKIQSLCLLALSAATVSLTAQVKSDDAPREGKGNPPAIAKMFERMDTNQDGVISKDEAKGRLKKNFDRIDADGNGSISADEFSAAHGKRLEAIKEGRERLKDADQDGNGTISLHEATEAGMHRLVEHFDKIDTNDDGEISREEMQAMRKHQQKQQQKQPGQ